MLFLVRCIYAAKLTGPNVCVLCLSGNCALYVGNPCVVVRVKTHEKSAYMLDGIILDCNRQALQNKKHNPVKLLVKRDTAPAD